MSSGIQQDPDIWRNIGTDDGQRWVLHATTVAVDGRAVILGGPSGCGKSRLAFELMALGAELVSDDRTVLRFDDNGLIACAPDGAEALIEARFVGLLRAAYCGPVPVAAAIDLRPVALQRMPPRRKVTLLGRSVPLLQTPVHGHSPATILHYLRYGMIDES